MRRLGMTPILRIARAHVPHDVHACTAGVGEPSVHLHHVADEHRLVEADAAGVDGYAVLSAPADRAGVSGLVAPLHHRAAVHLPLKLMSVGSAINRIVTSRSLSSTSPPSCLICGKRRSLVRGCPVQHSLSQERRGKVRVPAGCPQGVERLKEALRPDLLGPLERALWVIRP